MKATESYKNRLQEMLKEIELTALELYEHEAVSDTIEGQIYMAYEIVSKQNTLKAGEVMHVFRTESREH